MKKPWYQLRAEEVYGEPIELEKLFLDVRLCGRLRGFLRQKALTMGLMWMRKGLNNE